MGNACCTMRFSGYRMLTAGSAVAQETSFASLVPHAAAEADARRSAMTTPSFASDTYSQAFSATPKLERTDSMENLITCCICLDTMFEPVRSPCNHFFCRVCLRRLLEYDVAHASCPKCRGSLRQLKPNMLVVDEQLQSTITSNFAEDLVERRKEVEQEEEEYQAARQDRARRDRLMEHDPLQLMFESENDANRRRVLQRDLTLLMSLGFSQTMVQKALFVASGVHAEALHWLIDHQHHPNVETPWNMTQLQEQIALRNTRRNLVEILVSPYVEEVVPQRLHVSISSVTLSAAMGRACWCYCTLGLRAFGQAEIVFILEVMPGETQAPRDVLNVLRAVYRRVADGQQLADGTFLPFSSRQEHALFGDTDNVGFLLSRDHGQQLHGVPLPKVPYMFAITVRGNELEWARYFPSRVFLRMGRRFHHDYPFSLVNDRTREPVFQAGDFERTRNLSKGLRLPSASCIRVHPDMGPSVLLLTLPSEDKDRVRTWIESQSPGCILPFITSVARGSDGHLVYTPSNTARPEVLSHGNSQGRVLGASVCTIGLEQRRGRARIEQVSDTFVVPLSAEERERARQCLLRGEEYEYTYPFRCATKRFEIRWRPRANIESGLTHVTSALFPSRNVPSSAFEVVQPGNTTVLPLMATASRQLPVPEFHPRFRVLGVALDHAGVELEERVSVESLERFCVDLLQRINAEVEGHLLPLSETATVPPSTVTVHVEILPPNEATYRISKTWATTCPQMPHLTMRRWSELLHPTPVPAVSGGVEIQLTFELH